MALSIAFDQTQEPEARRNKTKQNLKGTFVPLGQPASETILMQDSWDERRENSYTQKERKADIKAY